MAGNTFPQIPATVWWGLREILKKTPTARVDESVLSAKLSVQTVAARQYLAEIKRTGIIDEECKATELGLKWRLDSDYDDAVSSILQQTYPESLIVIAPKGDANRSEVVSWFMNQGLGEGAAKNKAATYLLISSPVPTSSPVSQAKESAQPVSKARQAQKKEIRTNDAKEKLNQNQTENFPLNVNIQIHISADATKDQIDNIFSAMKRYLREE